jgi:hypothetical protein
MTIDLNVIKTDRLELPQQIQVVYSMVYIEQSRANVPSPDAQ